MEKIYGFVPIDIHDGCTPAFVEAARACHEAILPNIAGTQYYEWFLNEDGSKGYVLEVYDDSDGVALHGKMLDGRVSAVLEQATLRIDFAGDVPEAVQERMRRKLGEVSYSGRLSFGLMTEPSPHRTPPAGEERLYALAWFRPHQGKADQLRDLAHQAFECARDKDPGTLGYEWFADADGNFVVLDVYRDPQAMLAHMANCGPIMGQILTIADSRTILFGALPVEIEQRLRPELGITRYPRRLHGIG